MAPQGPSEKTYGLLEVLSQWAVLYALKFLLVSLSKRCIAYLCLCVLRFSWNHIIFYCMYMFNRRQAIKETIKDCEWRFLCALFLKSISLCVICRYLIFFTANISYIKKILKEAFKRFTLISNPALPRSFLSNAAQFWFINNLFQCLQLLITKVLVQWLEFLFSMVMVNTVRSVVFFSPIACD